MTYDLELVMNPFGLQNKNEHWDGDDGAVGEEPADQDYGDEDTNTTKNVQQQIKRRKKDKTLDLLDEGPVDLGLRDDILREEEARIEAAERRKSSEEEEKEHAPAEIDWKQIMQEEITESIEEDEDNHTPKEKNSSSSKQARMDLANTHSRIATFESILMNMFNEHTTTRRNLFRSIATNAERLWKHVQSSETIAKKKHRYPVEYHLLVVVYAMCHGYKCMEYTIVPFNAWIQEHTPQVRDLKRLTLTKNEVKVKNFTQAGKLFKCCIAELVRLQSAEIMDRMHWTP